MGLCVAYDILKFFLDERDMSEEEVIDAAVTQYDFDRDYIRWNIILIGMFADARTGIQRTLDGKLHMDPGWEPTGLRERCADFDIPFFTEHPKRRILYEKLAEKLGYNRKLKES